MQRPSPHSASPVRQAQDKLTHSHQPSASSRVPAPPHRSACRDVPILCVSDPHAAQLDVPGVGFVSQLPSSSLERSALTCSGCSFYRFVMLHLNPVTSDINLPSVHHLQQKMNGCSSPDLTCGRRQPGSLGVNTKLVYLKHKRPVAFDVCW